MLMKIADKDLAAPAPASERTGQERYLSVSRLRKSYDGRTDVIQDVDLQIGKGEFVTFLGPSGSGKTTMLSMIAGFETPTQGDITLNGRSLVQIPVHKRNIGIVFQNYALFPHMSALENVAFPLRMRKVPQGDMAQRARRALAIVGLEQHGDRLPRQLSGGQQQRVALARALVFEPDVLLLDEPLSALDKNLREQMQIEIKRLHTELRMTTVFVTHDQSEAMTMSDRIAVFNQGRVEQFDAPLRLYGAPCTHFVASFIGDSNFFEVTAEDAAAGRYRSPALGALAGPSSRHAPGTPLWLMVRPESLQLRIGDAAPGQGLPFEVDGVINYGNSAVVAGKAAGQAVRVRVPQAGIAALHVGARGSLTWAPDQAHVVPRDR